MKITNVEAFILESPYENRPPEGSDEAHGVKHCLLLKVSTDEGLVGWSDVETAPHVAAAVVNAPASGAACSRACARLSWAKTRSRWNGSGTRFIAGRFTTGGAVWRCKCSRVSIS